MPRPGRSQTSGRSAAGSGGGGSPRRRIRSGDCPGRPVGQRNSQTDPHDRSGPENAARCLRKNHLTRTTGDSGPVDPGRGRVPGPLGLSAHSPSGGSRSNQWSQPDRCLSAPAAATGWPDASPRSQSRNPDSPRDPRSDRATTSASRRGIVCRRSVSRCLGKSGGSFAGVTPLRRTHGPAVAGLRSLCRQ